MKTPYTINLTAKKDLDTVTVTHRQSGRLIAVYRIAADELHMKELVSVADSQDLLKMVRAVARDRSVVISRRIATAALLFVAIIMLGWLFTILFLVR